MKKEEDVLHTQKQKINEFQLELSSQKSSLKVTEESVKEGNIKPQNVLPEKTLSREKNQELQAMIDMGLDRKRCIEKILGTSLKRKLS